MVKKKGNMLAIAVLLIGIIMLIEGSTTLFVVLSAPQIAAQADAALIYVVAKIVAGLYAVFAGYTHSKN